MHAGLRGLALGVAVTALGCAALLDLDAFQDGDAVASATGPGGNGGMPVGGGGSDVGGGGSTGGGGLGGSGGTFAPGELLWADLFGDGAVQSAKLAAFDDQGRAHVSGDYSGAIDFGAGVMAPAGGGYYLVSFGLDPPTPIWSRTITGGVHQLSSIGAGAPLVAAGKFTTELTSSDDISLTSSNMAAYAVTLDAGDGSVDASGKVAEVNGGGVLLAPLIVRDGAAEHMALVFTDDVTVFLAVGNAPASTAGPGDPDILVLKRGAGGAIESHFEVKGPAANFTLGGAALSQGRLLLSGTFAGDFTEAGLSTVAGDTDGYVLAADPADGAKLWAAQLVGDPYSVLVAARGDTVAIAGTFTGTLDLGGGSVTSATNQDVFVAAFDAADGALRWVQTSAGGQGEFANALAIDAGGDVIVAGFFDESLGFGTPSVSTGQDGFVTKHAARDGQLVWAKIFGGDLSQNIYAVATDATGRVLAAGSCGGTLVVDGRSFSGQGGGDALLALVAP